MIVTRGLGSSLLITQGYGFLEYIPPVEEPELPPALVDVPVAFGGQSITEITMHATFSTTLPPLLQEGQTSVRMGNVISLYSKMSKQVKYTLWGELDI